MSNEQILIHNFTKPELDYLKAMCNFTPLELELLNLRNEQLTIECAAEEMNLSASTAYRINKGIKNKINKVLQNYS